jgi:hypothetical protein
MAKTNVHILSYGGGVNSSALYFYLVHMIKKPLDLVIFANTGEESAETLDTVHRMKEQCKKDNIEFIETQSDKGRMVDYYTKNRAIPSFMKRDCTSKFKISPIRQVFARKEYKKKYHIIQYLGIASNEAHRMTMSDVNYMTYSYPFCDDKINRKGNEDILKQFKFKASKSGCLGCMFQSKESWRKFVLENNAEFQRWKFMEENNMHFKRKYTFTKEMKRTGEYIEEFDDYEGKYVKRRALVETGKMLKIPAKPLYLNGAYSLAQIENFVKYQKTLDKWVNKNDGDLVCPNTQGGCFL